MLQQVKKLFSLLLLINASCVYGADAVPISLLNDNQYINLLPYLEFYEDPEKQLQLHEIIKNPKDYPFNKFNLLHNSLGFNQNAVWIRFKLKNINDISNKFYILTLDSPLLDSLTLYSPNSQGTFDKQISGDLQDFSHRDIKHRNPVFLINVSKQSSDYYYLRIDSLSSMAIPLQLWVYDDFLEYTNTSQLLFGIYYGFMLLILLTALYSYKLLREKIFLYYSAYLLTMIAFQSAINGFGFQYFWGHIPVITTGINSSLVGLLVISALVFSGSFLQIKTHPVLIRTFYKIVYLLAFTTLALALTSQSLYAMKLSTITGIVFVPAVIIASVYSLHKKYKPALYFVFAWSVFMIGVITFGFRTTGYLPHNFFTTYAMQIGTVLEVIILSMSLVERFKRVNRQRITAEKNAKQYLLKLNSELESLVAERTASLEKSLKEIKILKDFLPICSYCKKIKDDEGSWEKLESYISSHSDTQFSHGICPDCAEKVRSEHGFGKKV